MSGAVASALPIWMGGLAVAGAVAAGGIWYASQGGQSEAPAAAVTEQSPSVQTVAVAVAPAPKPEPEAEQLPADPDPFVSQDPPPEPAPETTAVAPETPEPDAAPEEETTAIVPEETAETPLPRLDELRLDPGGIAVIAGRATPLGKVLLQADGAEIARAEVDARGAFAAIAILEPSPDPRVLTLIELAEDGSERLSPDQFILAPIAEPEPENEPVVVAEVAPDVATVAEAAEAPETTPQTNTEASQTIAQAPAPEVPELTVEPEKDLAISDAAEPAPEPVAVAVVEPSAPTAPSAEDVQTDVAVETNAPAPEAEPAATVETAAVAAVTVEPEAPLQAPIVQANIADAPTAPQATTNAAASAPAPAPKPNAAPPPTSRLAILRSSPEGIEVVRVPGERPKAQDRVALDAISYSATGDVQLSGRAQQDAAEVRVYLNNRPVAALAVDESGDWRGDVPDVESGVYTLRIDAVSADGKVTSRVETPFKREAPELLLAAVETDKPVQAITVQAGTTLWAIARDRYGDGLEYVQVFEANRDQIRDPDLIYPGQVFTLPTDGN